MSLAFFNNSSSTSRGDNCSNVECAVVSMDLRTQCCPYISHQGCGADGESVADIVKTATNFAGRQFKNLGQPPTEAFLQSTLMKGTPVMPIIQWEHGGGHALVAAVCVPGVFGSNYYLHDPERSDWEVFSYMRLMDYTLLY